ncbi:cyclic lactone autoinducer peptide [Ruminococcus sp. OM06-36AC]|nr:cyclic lactone autoinducer peptide [Clostridiales bacterium]MBS6579846.1 cyclic lactone autoinducer peptide [Clostridiales bacterium]RGM76693.1 cyclic lactone autoinducer peptide [Ruminococcus sp. OM06-36AC]
MKKMFLRFGQCFAALAFVFATVTANSSCMIIAHQPEEPESVKKLRKF